MKFKYIFILFIFIFSKNIIFGQDTASQLEQARNEARLRLNREEQYKRLLLMYNAIDYKSLTQMTHIEYPTNPDALYRFEQQWERISPGLVIIVDPYNIEIYGGSSENTYILQTSYMTPDDYRFGTVTYRQLVIQDNLGLINLSHIRRIPNANGSELIERHYNINRRILIKCIGMTNVTLTNGRLVPRPLFRTIPFNMDDPNNPDRQR